MTLSWVTNPIITQETWRRHYLLSQKHQNAVNLAQRNLDKELDQSSLLKNDRTTSVGKVNWGDHNYVLKRYNARSRAHVLKRALRRSRAKGCWRMSYHFQAAGLNVSEPVLMLEKRWGPFCGTAYFLNELLEGEELLTFLPKASSIEKQQIADAIHQAFERMSLAKITHGDLKASNILWVNKELYFIDLDAAREHRTRSKWQFFHNKDKRRFLKNWREHPDLLMLFEKL